MKKMKIHQNYYQIHRLYLSETLLDIIRSFTVLKSLNETVNRDHPLGKTTSRGRPEDIPKGSPMDAPHMVSMKGQGTFLAHILMKSSTNVLRTLKYEVLRTSQCDVLRMAAYSSICMSWDVPY